MKVFAGSKTQRTLSVQIELDDTEVRRLLTIATTSLPSAVVYGHSYSDGHLSESEKTMVKLAKEVWLSFYDTDPSAIEEVQNELDMVKKDFGTLGTEYIEDVDLKMKMYEAVEKE